MPPNGAVLQLNEAAVRYSLPPGFGLSPVRSPFKFPPAP